MLRSSDATSAQSTRSGGAEPWSRYPLMPNRAQTPSKYVVMWGDDDSTCSTNTTSKPRRLRPNTKLSRVQALPPFPALPASTPATIAVGTLSGELIEQPAQHFARVEQFFGDVAGGACMSTVVT